MKIENYKIQIHGITLTLLKKIRNKDSLFSIFLEKKTFYKISQQ